MSYSHNYAVSGLLEPGKMNVLSLEQRAAQGNRITFDDTGNQYVVESCGEPSPTEFDAACLAINARITLRVAPISRRPTVAAKQLAAALPIYQHFVCGGRQRHEASAAHRASRI